MAIVALTLLGLPIGHAMIGGSVLYLWMTSLDIGTAAEQLSNGMYNSFVLLAIPLFILAAEFMTIGSITERLLNFCNAFVGRFRGGLAHVNVVQSIIFAGMSGSALADAASSGKLMQKMMTQDGKYTASFAAALTAVSSVIGPIIPPSIPMVIYALVSDTSIGYLFLGGVIPGLLLGIAQMAYISFVAKRRNFPVEKAVPLRDIPRITWEAFPALMMPVILFGCLYSGITTPTEAAAVACVYAALVTAFVFRELGWLDIVTTFNVIYLVNVTLAGFGMYLLARRLTGRTPEAFVAGLLFAWSPFMVARGQAHFSLVAAAPLPIFMLMLHRAWDTRRLRDAVLAGATLAWATFCDPYYGVYCLMLGAALPEGRFPCSPRSLSRCRGMRAWPPRTTKGSCTAI
jgi:TRAP-type mannitol/chloroaromatic compound transport system permease large subunit